MTNSSRLGRLGRLAGLTSLATLSALAAACAGAAPEAPAPPSSRAAAAEPGMPAPPPPVVVAASDRAGGAVAASPSPVGVARAESPRMAGRASVAGPSGPVISASGPRAGEWDDNANYREFQKWIGALHAGHHVVDVADRQFLVVRDADGKAVPRCAVVVRDEAQHGVALTTTSSGRALLFPHAEGLVGSALTATAQCLGGKTVRFDGTLTDGIVDLHLDRKRAAPKREIAIGFVLDTTGSMGEEIAAVKTTIQKVTQSLGTEGVDVKIGLVEYKDRTDGFVTRVYPMTANLSRFSSDVGGLSAGGGGDYPESMNEGLHVALNKLDWGGSATVKMAVLIGDAPPHLDYANDFDYANEMKDASHRGVQVLTIAASGMDALGQAVFRQIAQYTDATNLFVLRGGAGPQSTGAGDPLSSCGGTQSQFRSGNLDGLIVERIRREMKAVDGDPMRIPGVGKDENAKPCAERVKVAG